MNTCKQVYICVHLKLFALTINGENGYGQIMISKIWFVNIKISILLRVKPELKL